MAELLEYNSQNKPCNQNNNVTTKGRLKLFGFHVTNNVQEDEVTESTTTTSPSETSGNRFNPPDGRKYVCQYCHREFANSQALGGHQNAHKKERQQLKRAQMQASRNAAFSAMHSPMISSFVSPPHLFAPVGTVASPSWFYVARGAAAFHAPQGCLYPSSAIGGPQQDLKVHRGRIDVPSLSRFTRVEDGAIYDESFGLNLHLSL